jgi:hypothetical protein
MLFKSVSAGALIVPGRLRVVRSMALAGGVAAALLGGGALRAETVGGALVKAYFNNPDINQQRAAVRASD